MNAPGSIGRARWLALLALGATLAGCGEEPQTRRHAFFALGTLVEISVFDPPAGTGEAVREAETALLDAEHRWRAWGEGELAGLNRRMADGESVSIPAEIVEGIRRAREIARLSGGRFNPAIGRMVAAWGFHQEERAPGPPPAAGTLAPLLPPPRLAELAENDGRWSFTDSRTWLDMGAFAKGLAVEKAIAVLRRRGIENAIVNAGGDLKAIGRHGARSWNIGVRDPRGGGVLAALTVEGNESVFTSGDYERRFEWRGQAFHHILDPATGQPAQGVTSVTVIHPDAALADAAATALFVAGPGEWAAVAGNLDIDLAMLVLESGAIQLTPGMRERAAFEDEPAMIEIVSP